MGIWIIKNISWLISLVCSFILGYQIGRARVMNQVIEDGGWTYTKKEGA